MRLTDKLPRHGIKNLHSPPGGDRFKYECYCGFESEEMIPDLDLDSLMSGPALNRAEKKRAKTSAAKAEKAFDVHVREARAADVAKLKAEILEARDGALVALDAYSLALSPSTYGYDHTHSKELKIFNLPNLRVLAVWKYLDEFDAVYNPPRPKKNTIPPPGARHKKPPEVTAYPFDAVRRTTHASKVDLYCTFCRQMLVSNAERVGTPSHPAWKENSDLTDTHTTICALMYLGGVTTHIHPPTERRLPPELLPEQPDEDSSGANPDIPKIQPVYLPEE